MSERRHVLVSCEHNGKGSRQGLWTAVCKCGWKRSKRRKKEAERSYGGHLQFENYIAYLSRCDK